MRIRPVRRYAAPLYPTRAYLLEHPELLRWVPQRWRKNPLVLAVLGLALPLVQACTAADDAKGANSATVRVAPLFVHGDGRGAFGCVAVNPPVFLSEKEAQEVIRDEAKKAGLDLAKTDLTFKEVSLPVTDRYSFLENERAQRERKPAPKTRKRQTGTLALDGYDAKRRVAFEFVSQQDFEAWEKRTDACTVSDYDLKATAEQLREGLTHTQGDTIVGILYEPGACMRGWLDEREEDDRKPTPTTTWEEREQATKKQGEQELRAQVRDFLEWLKAQGVI